MDCFVSNILYSLVRSNYGFIREKKQQQIGLLWLFIHVAVIITSFCMLFLYKCYLVLHNSWILLNKFVNKTNIWIVYKTSFFELAWGRLNDWQDEYVSPSKHKRNKKLIWILSSFVLQKQIQEFCETKWIFFFYLPKIDFFCWKESTITL